MSIRCARVALLAAFVSWGSINSASGQGWLAKHRLTWGELTTWLSGEAKGYRLVYLNGYDMAGSPRYAVVAVKNEKNLEWYWHAGTQEFVQKKDAEHRAKGCRPICVSGFLRGRSPVFCAVWVKNGLLARGKIFLNLTEKEYTDRLKEEKTNLFMPSRVTGHADGAGSYRFTALFVPAGKIVWKEQHNLTEEKYQKSIDQFSIEKYRPRNITVYPTPAGLRYAVVFVQDGMDWYARHGLSSEEYQTEFTKAVRDGFRPISVAGYMDSSTAGPELFDEVMHKYMAEHGIKAGTLAVSRNGKLLLEHGYGFGDAAGRRPIEADDPMRLASVTKPITAAAIHKLVRESKLSLETKVFPLLRLQPPPGQQPDPRLNDITVRHLLEHKGGWDYKQNFDPMFKPGEVAAALKGPCPPGPVDVIRYMMGQPLQFDPGTNDCYSNFGYCVLGRVIEKVSGQTYLAYVRKNICDPLGMRSVELGRSLPQYRNPREPVYRSPRKSRNVVEPESTEQVPLPDGTFYLEAMDSHGGLIASSRDVVRFLDAYWISGETRQGNGRAYVAFGSMPGTSTMALQRPNGVNLAVLFNQNVLQSERDRAKLRDIMEEAADRQTGSGLRYAALWVKSD
jgi:CubicO group peptidase (beta-lactamase class C family)